MSAPTFAAGQLVHFLPVLTGRVACKVDYFHRETQRYSLLVTATAHPTYKRGERIVTSANWVRAR